MHHDLDILPRGMEHLEHALVGHQGEEWREVEARRHGIDQTAERRPGHLDEAEFRPVGRLAHEFGVDGDITVGRQTGAKAG